MTYSSQPPRTPALFRWRGRIGRRLSHALFAGLLAAVLAASCGAVAPRADAAVVFSLVSPTVRSGATMPDAYVGARGNCQGRNQSPPLSWAHAPQGTASYAVTMADLDAKVGVVWLWLMFNIPANATGLPENAAADPKLKPPGAQQARNGFDTVGYLGPCPKKDKLAHHYLITVWALNEAQLPFKNGTASQAVAIYLRRHALGHASLTPHYGGG